MQDILERYAALLGEVDRWFAGCLERHRDRIVCGQGCSACCRGLFDITLLDALFLRQGFDRLPDAVQQDIRLKAAARLDDITARWPAFTAPWILNPIPEEEWDAMMPDEDETPCVLLSAEGQCLVYDYRPMTCRLNGIPLIDTSGEELFDDWCTLNFTDHDPLAFEDLRHPFNDLFAQELLLFRELTRRLLGEAVSEMDTIIPAAVFLDEEMIRTM
ncbi:MAG TPA: YkgJ family cysteine cluster protein [Desulfuromonadaceae bacterium]